jgi:hypothetical protein
MSQHETPLSPFANPAAPGQTDGTRAPSHRTGPGKEDHHRGICLCQTTLPDLQKLDNHLRAVTVEEMDFGKRCQGGRDSRYDNGKGYSSDSFPGMIFQKDPETDYISKIRLTKGFRGTLPDGSVIDMDHFLLKDLFRSHPAMKDKWGSRDCSDFWSFSNDTIAFFVRIDPEKKPQYPIDEAYYLNKPVEGIDIFISCYDIYHQTEKISLFRPDEPVFFPDSIRTNAGFIEQFQPSEFAFVNVYKDSNAIKLAGKQAGEQARNGVIYVFTKKYVRQHYWEYFRSKSPEYRQAVPDLKTELSVVYMLNGKTLDIKDQELELFKINDANFQQLKMTGPRTVEITATLTR